MRYLRPLVLTVALLCALPFAAQAQTATPASKFAWDQPAADLATAQAYTYRYYADAAITSLPLTSVVVTTGTVAGQFPATSAIPAFTPGTHTISIVAVNVDGESLKSNTVTFQMKIVPLAPLNFRIVVNELGVITSIERV